MSELVVTDNQQQPDQLSDFEQERKDNRERWERKELKRASGGPEGRRSRTAPDTIEVGDLRFRSVASTAQDQFHISHIAMIRILQKLKVPIIVAPGGRYYNETVFELALIALSWFHASGFALPGAPKVLAKIDDLALPHNLPPTFPDEDNLQKAIAAFTLMAKIKNRSSSITLRNLLKKATAKDLG